jgi:Tfp pilus assembly protein PilF
MPRPRSVLLGVIAVLLLAGGGYLGGRHLWAWYHYHAAQRAVERREFHEARDHLAACLEVWPASASTHLLAARTARRSHCFDTQDFLGVQTAARSASFEEAMDQLDTCRQLGGPAEAINLEWDLLRAQQGKLEQVEKKLLACLDGEHPDSTLILEVLTWEWMRRHRLPEAQHYLDLWLTRRPNEREALVRRGWVRERLLNPYEAIQDYQKALDLDPERDQREHDRIRLRLAEILVQKNRAAEAVQHFEAMYERQPDNPAVVLGLARCRRQLRQPEEARRLLDALLAVRPRDGQALGERGRLALDDGRFVQAEQWLRRAAALCPYDRQITYNLFQCLKKQNKEKEAQKYSARLHQLRADEKRMSQLMQEMLRAPQDADLCCETGTIFLRNGMPAEGLRWLANALWHDSKHRAAHQALAEYFEGLGQKERAAPHRRVLRQLKGSQEKGQ